MKQCLRSNLARINYSVQQWLDGVQQRLWNYLATIKLCLRQWLGSVRQHLDDPWEKNFLLALITSAGIIILLIATRQGDLLVIVGGLATFIAGVIGMNAPRETWMRDIAPELIGISIGVMGIDQLYQIRLAEDDRQAVIRQLGSPSHDFAIEAVRIARYEGWLVDGSLEGADLEDANLARAYLVDADLGQANLARAILRSAILRSAKLERAILRRAILIDAHLEYAFLRRAHLEDAILTQAHLARAYLVGAILSSAVMSGTQLVGADLSGADLRSADFSGANLEGANLTRAHYTADTIWSEGFDPAKAGAILVE
jgi:hypothetical protein